MIPYYVEPPQFARGNNFKAIILVVSGDIREDNLSMYVKSRANLKYWTESAKRAFVDSGLFSKVIVVNQDDYKEVNHIDSIYHIKFLERYDTALLHYYISGITFCIVPYKEIRTISVVVEEDVKKINYRVYKREEVLTIAYQMLPLILPLVIYSRANSKPQIYYDACMDIIKQAHEEGAF